VWTYLKGNGCLCHILEKGSSKENPTFSSWDEKDSMEPNITDTCMFHNTKKDTRVLAHILRQMVQLKCFEIKVKVVAVKQRTKGVTEYAT